MTIDEIAALPIVDLADPGGCHLFLWTTDEMLREGWAVRVARGWGFEPCGPSIVWHKPNFGMGCFPRPQHEIALVCRRGRITFSLNNVGTVHRWKQDYSLNGGKRHSVKPEGFQDLVERASPGPYLELFARHQRLGWDTWGNESLNHVAMPS